MKAYSIRSLAVVLLLAAPTLQAEIIKIPVGQQKSVQSDTQLPPHGESRAAVKARYGDPLKWTQAVGEPPISRWEYPDFSVYFEHDHVVHAVLMGSAKAAH